MLFASLLSSDSHPPHAAPDAEFEHDDLLYAEDSASAPTIDDVYEEDEKLPAHDDDDDDVSLVYGDTEGHDKMFLQEDSLGTSCSFEDSVSSFSDEGAERHYDSDDEEEEHEEDTAPCSSAAEISSYSGTLFGTALSLPAPKPKIVSVTKLHPVEETLMNLIIDNNLKKELYASMMDWASFASNYAGYNFNNIPTYDTTIKRMKKKYFHVCGGSPTSEIVKMPGYSPMHVYRFPILQIAKSILGDPEIMKGAVFQYESRVNGIGEHIYGEANTGKFWQIGQAYLNRRIARMDPTQKKKTHILVPGCIFVDGTLADRLGRLSVEPVLLSFLNICNEQRKRARAWSILGFVPPYPKSPKEKAKDGASLLTNHLYPQYVHECLRSILKEFRDLDNNANGIDIYMAGIGYVCAHFKLSLVYGDTEGHDKLCGHYGVYSSNLQRMSRDCDIPQWHGNKVKHPCTMVKMSNMQPLIEDAVNILISSRVHGTVKAARESLQSVSQLVVRPSFFDFDFCGCEHGIFASCPFERLHAFCLGLMKMSLEFVFNVGTLPDSYMAWYTEYLAGNATIEDRPSCSKVLNPFVDGTRFEGRFRLLTMAARRQSDREMPRTPFKNGVTDLTRLNAQEYPGLCMLTLVGLKELLDNNMNA
jgi:hypothetical protein